MSECCEVLETPEISNSPGTCVYRYERGISECPLFRIQGDRQRALSAVRKSVEAFDENLVPNLKLVNLEQGPLWVHKTMPKMLTLFFGVLGVLALCLAGSGIYGVMSYIINQRIKEVGVRVALGGSAGQVLRLVLLQGLAPVVAGIVSGIAGALALSWAAHSTIAFPGSSDFYHGVAFYDPVAVLGLSVFVAPLRSLRVSVRPATFFAWTR